MRANSQYAQQMNRERAVAPFVPYSSHVAPNTIVTKDGDYLRIWKIAGIAFETTDVDEILRRKEQLNTLYRSIGSNNVAIWSHQIRRKTTDRLRSVFDNDFCRDLDQKYYDSFEHPEAGYTMMANEMYLTVVFRPQPSRLDRALVKSSRRSRKEILDDQREAIRRLNEVAYQIEAGMKRYGADVHQGIEELTTYEKDGALFSEKLRFLNYLITGEWQEVRVPMAPLGDYLGTAWIHAGVETIEIRSPSSLRYAQCIDFKDYNAHTEPGILNGLMYSDYEFVITQSFSFMSKREGLDFLTRQGKQLANSEDGSISQVEQISNAIDQLIAGEFVMGEYHYSLMIFGETVQQAVRNTTSAMIIIQEQGFLASLVATATDAAFYAQLPCNWSYRPRVAGLTSQNFAGLCSFHNFRSGKRDGNPWGQALTLLKSPSGQPLYLNFHYSKGDEDNFDKKLLGNTRIIGQSGAGKTVLMNFCLAQAQKYRYRSASGFCTIYLDKDEGAKGTIRAIGGKYLSVKNGKPTGFNPFQIEPTEKNILFLEKLCRAIITSDKAPLTTEDENRLSHAVRIVMRMTDLKLRRLSTVLQNITEGEQDKGNSLAKRLARWCVDDGEGRRGPYWWVLDCPWDLIDFSTHSNYGIDGTDFLDNAEVRTPISMYLLHRMDTVIDGRRFMYLMDEAWKWIDDEAFADFAGNKQLTIRKENGLGVFSTQMPSSLLKSRIASALVQQVATEIYLPNPKADYHEYIDGFKVTEAEFHIIKSLGEESRMFLVKQGQQSFVARLDLSNVKDSDGNVVISFDDELAILSGSSDNNELMDEVIAEVGEKPSDWLPVFHERRKLRVASSKLKPM
ncbi:VirB4 family type IV secretion/conjugal transfer ATPase [Pseudomonas sp. LPH60]|uniref:VirB4 family type IV secretion/conjugal transfer ATPase n=1 Tax=Pseudomonas sp. LPH60 TaxID=3065906 RepID=UPI00273C173B|nr:VirB4 family type IV secretion/conjugal transfer ATPase [Pseudomonas sp. LPH60]MDP4573450.1 VirB4 family type IV secretion/conjugal transfer ATPase [Pseudomonas sp. LPH60]